MKKYGGFIPGIRAGRADRGVPRLRPVPHHAPRRALPRLIALIPLIAFVLRRRQPELPVRRHLDPDHGRRRPGDREADREPAAAAQLRRVPPLMRLVILGPPGAGKGTQAACIAEHLGDPAISTGDIFRANVTERHRRSGSRRRRYMDAGELRPRRGHQRDGRATGSPSPTPRRASCSTATRAPSPRSRSSTACSPRTAPPLDAVLELTVDDDEVVAAAAQAGRDRGPRRRHRGRHPATAMEIYDRADRAADPTSTASRGLLVEVDGMGEVDEVTTQDPHRPHLTHALSVESSRTRRACPLGGRRRVLYGSMPAPVVERRMPCARLPATLVSRRPRRAGPPRSPGRRWPTRGPSQRRGRPGRPAPAYFTSPSNSTTTSPSTRRSTRATRPPASQRLLRAGPRSRGHGAARRVRVSPTDSLAGSVRSMARRARSLVVLRQLDDGILQLLDACSAVVESRHPSRTRRRAPRAAGDLAQGDGKPPRR